MTTPLWPAGDLPLKSGDQLSFSQWQIVCVAAAAVRLQLLIFLEGEIAGRPEGGIFGGALQ